MGISYLALASLLASTVIPAAGQNVYGNASAACTPHPPESLQCRLSNGSVSGSPCLTSFGVFCCPSESDCTYPSSSSSLPRVSTSTSPSTSQSTLAVGGPSCSEHPAEALQCAFENGTVVGSPCLTATGVLCCSVESDCMYPGESSSASSAASKPTSGSSTNGSSTTLSHPSMATSAIPKFTNEAVLGSGIATAAIWGVIGAGFAFI